MGAMPPGMQRVVDRCLSVPTMHESDSSLEVFSRTRGCLLLRPRLPMRSPRNLTRKSQPNALKALRSTDRVHIRCRMRIRRVQKVVSRRTSEPLWVEKHETKSNLFGFHESQRAAYYNKRDIRTAIHSKHKLKHSIAIVYCYNYRSADGKLGRKPIFISMTIV